MFVYLNGLMLGFSLVTALGPQNVFLIRQGALRNHAVLSAVICFVCDALLVCASVAGLHKALQLHPALQVWITWFGVAFLLFYGLQALRRSFRAQARQAGTEQKKPERLQIVILALGFSLLNPHAIIDSLVIIGGGGSQFPNHQQAFLSGVITSSFLWFTSLTFATRHFSELLSCASVWRRIELASGLLMVCLSIKLAASLY